MNAQTLVALGGYCGRLGVKSPTGWDFVSWSAVIDFLDGMHANRRATVLLLTRLINSAGRSAFLVQWLKRQLRRAESRIAAARYARARRETQAKSTAVEAWQNVDEVDDSEIAECEVLELDGLTVEHAALLSWAMP